VLLQIDLVKGMMDCLYAECKPCITDCVMAELEKLGQKYRVALKVAKVRRGWQENVETSLHSALGKVAV
jgi:rRNA-processing protein FCF1